MVIAVRTSASTAGGENLRWSKERWTSEGLRVSETDAPPGALIAVSSSPSDGAACPDVIVSPAPPSTRVLPETVARFAGCVSNKVEKDGVWGQADVKL